MVTKYHFFTGTLSQLSNNFSQLFLNNFSKKFNFFSLFSKKNPTFFLQFFLNFFSKFFLKFFWNLFSVFLIVFSTLNQSFLNFFLIFSLLFSTFSEFLFTFFFFNFMIFCWEKKLQSYRATKLQTPLSVQWKTSYICRNRYT